MSRSFVLALSSLFGGSRFEEVVGGSDKEGDLLIPTPVEVETVSFQIFPALKAAHSTPHPLLPLLVSSLLNCRPLLLLLLLSLRIVDMGVCILRLLPAAAFLAVRCTDAFSPSPRLNRATAIGSSIGRSSSSSALGMEPPRGCASRPFEKKKIAVFGAGGYLGAVVFGFLQRASSL